VPLTGVTSAPAATSGKTVFSDEGTGVASGSALPGSAGHATGVGHVLVEYIRQISVKKTCLIPFRA